MATRQRSVECIGFATLLAFVAAPTAACGARTALASSNGAGATPEGGIVQGLLAISAGRSHTCALRSNGTVLCWGSDTVGQLGNGTTNQLTNDPVAVSNLTDAVAVSAGPDFTCAVRSGGTLVCWGSDTLGSLAPGLPHPSPLPAKVDGVMDVEAIATGLGSTCALTSRGVVMCWNALSGQVGATAIPALNGALAIGTSDFDTCALFPGGTVSCAGPLPGDIPMVDGAIGISVAPTATNLLGCALVPGEDGFLVGCWTEGLQDSGAFTVATVALGVRATAVSTGGSHTCALLEDTTVACWGNNEFGQLGDGTTNDSASPVPVSNLSGVTAISAGWYHTCALLADGTAACWGNNQARTDDGGVTNATTPVAVEF